MSQLTPREQRVLGLLKDYEVVGLAHLAEEFELRDNALEAFMSRLRRKIAPKKIYAHYGIGYSLKPNGKTRRRKKSVD